MRSLLLRAVCAVVLVSTLAPSSAVADSSDVPLLSVIATNTANTNSSILAQTTAIASDFTSSTLLITNAISSLQAQVMANLSVEQQAQANLQQVIDRQDVATNISRERLDAMKGATSGFSSCNTIYGGAGRQAFTPALLAWKESLFNEDSAWLNNQRTINGQAVPSGKSLGDTTDASVNAHCQNFASQADIDNGICPAGTAISAEPAADMNLGHLLNDTSMGPVDSSGAQAFLRLTAHPLPFAPLPPAVAATEQGRQEALSRETQSAKLSAAYALETIAMANRQPLQNATDLQDWAEGTAKDAGYTPNASGLYFPNGVSLDDYEKLRADSWNQDTKFTAAVSAAPTDTALLKDLIGIEAFRAQIDVENKMIQEQIALGVGLLIANSVQSNMSDH